MNGSNHQKKCERASCDCVFEVKKRNIHQRFCGAPCYHAATIGTHIRRTPEHKHRCGVRQPPIEPVNCGMLDALKKRERKSTGADGRGNHLWRKAERAGYLARAEAKTIKNEKSRRPDEKRIKPL